MEAIRDHLERKGKDKDRDSDTDSNKDKTAEVQTFMAARRKALEVMPFTSATKYSGVVFEDGKYLLGAAEFVMGNAFEEIADEIREYTKKVKNLCFSEKTAPFFVENIGIWRMIYTWTGKKRPKVRTFRRFFINGKPNHARSGRSCPRWRGPRRATPGPLPCRSSKGNPGESQPLHRGKTPGHGESDHRHMAGAGWP